MTEFLKSTLILFATFILFYFGYQSYKNASTYIELSKAISHKNNTTKSMQKKLNKFLEDLSLGIYDKYSSNNDKLKVLERNANNTYNKSINNLYYFFMTVFIFGVILFLIDKEIFLIFLGIATLTSLIVALFSPLLMMTVYKSFPLIGEVILSYDSKSISSTITKLFHQANYIVALIVLTFSVLIPLFKSVLIISYGFFKETGISKKMVLFIEKIGKWSMADVFIVAVLVVFFSTKQDIHTSIKIEVGLYFFIGYVLLSMLGSTILAQKHAKE